MGQDGSKDKGACCPTRQPKSYSSNPHGRRREQAPSRCSLTLHACHGTLEPTHLHKINKFDLKKKKRQLWNKVVANKGSPWLAPGDMKGPGRGDSMILVAKAEVRCDVVR